MSFAGESSRHHQELVQQDDAAMDTDDNPSPEALNNYSRQVVQHATLQPTQHAHAARKTLNTNTTAVSARQQQQQQQRQQEHHLAMPDSNATTTEDYNTIIGHIRHEAEGMSHRSKLNSTFVHLNYFLKNYTEGAMKEKTASTLVYKDINDDFIGSWHNYLANYAHIYCNPKKGLLMFESIRGYASAFKTHCIVEKWSDRPVPCCFEAVRWKGHQLHLMKSVQKRNKDNGIVALSNPRQGSTMDERETMVKLGVWDGGVDTANFVATNICMYHCVGRGSEIATTLCSSLMSREIVEATQKADIASVHLVRDKNGKEQQLDMFPHIRHWWACWYFGIAYLLVMCNASTKYLFQPYADKAFSKPKSNDRRRQGEFY
jgi:hypothetical protein